MERKDLVIATAFVLACEATGIIGAVLTVDAIPT